jgi:NADH-quinone oxidoreductase subunit M
MVSHGIISAGLFYMVDMLYRRTHTRDIPQYGGVVSVGPKLSVMAFIFILGLISLPITSGFVGEIMVTIAVFKMSQLLGILTVIGVVLAPIYGLSFYRKVFLGKPAELVQKIKDITLKEFAICSVLILMMGWIGVYPKTVIEFLDNTVKCMVKG